MRRGAHSKKTTRSRKSWGTLLALGVFAGLLCVSAVTFAAQAPKRAVEDAESQHPAIAAGQSCVSCKEVPGHAYRHTEPYTGSCGICHTTSSWTRDISYAHKTADMSRGMHLDIGCAFCHTADNPAPSADCAGCHKPNHPAADGCASCHDAMAWHLPKDPPSGHVSLSGGHIGLTCFDCHTGVDAFTRPKQCVDCHSTHHGGLTDCARCHDPATDSWKANPRFSHDRYFVLKGAHAKLACTKCHEGNKFAGARPNCSACHGVKHGGLTNCGSCHTTVSFTPSTFKHATVFVLTGAHARLGCRSCHSGDRYAASVRKGPGCSGCHGTKHGGLTDCSRCHTTSSFKAATFTHSTVWRLTGAHAKLSCEACHPNGRYAKTKGGANQCVACHGVHHGDQHDCVACHSTKSFIPAKKVKHPSSVPLSGAHAKMSCTLCHPSLDFAKSPVSCRACHSAPHGSPTDCLRCHRPTKWNDVHFTHDPIGNHTGKPIEKECTTCHPGGNYGSYRCDACHPNP